MTTQERYVTPPFWYHFQLLTGSLQLALFVVPMIFPLGSPEITVFGRGPISQESAAPIRWFGLLTLAVALYAGMFALLRHTTPWRRSAYALGFLSLGMLSQVARLSFL